MDGFLSQVAADLWERYGEGVSGLSVVFPSRRASLFFGEALAGMIDRPMWQPAAVTIDEVAARLSGLAVGDRLRLVTELYKVWVEAHPADDFDSFHFWGELLLGDFDSVDKYLVDADALFSNLVDLHELDFLFEMEPAQREAIERFWGSFGSAGGATGAGGSPEQRDFLRVWRTLGPVYHRFRERLRALGIAYQGMVYREAAERIAAGTAAEIPDRHYVVAGFNALSRAEQTMLDYLRTRYRVDFYWDTDDYFTRDPGQEAGRFMRDDLRRFPPAGRLRGGHRNFEKPKTIRSVATASDVLQCKWAGEALAALARQTGRAPGRETAVVLCDESLLTPLLWSMPPEVEAINITMGYPLRMDPAYTFVERLIELQNRRRGTTFYHSDVEGLLRHPYLAGAAGSGAATIPDFVYISASRLRTSPLFEKIFAAPEGWREVSDYLVDILSEVARPSVVPQSDAMRTQFFSIIADHIRRLANSLEGCGIELSTKTYARLLRRTLQGATIPFEGEPLEGVQVMGILETRALDFENIIFLSAGDATMPGSLVGAPSFIPHNLKAAYGLPTPEHHEGVYAYHFMRLVSRARRVDAVWSRTADDRTAGSPSRYLLQLDYESPHRVEHLSVDVDVNLSPPEPIVVAKEGAVMEALDEFLTHARTISPSLFFTHTECPLKFYFRGVARLRPEQEVAEEIDGALLGSILHRAMQLLYTPLVGSVDPRARIGALVGSAEVERAVTEATSELCPGGEGSGPGDWGGAMLLAHRTIKSYIERGILPRDASLVDSFTVDGLERRVSMEVGFEGSRSVVFSGIADRVDRLPDGSLRVVDYKTGSPRNNASALQQMGLYAMMLGGDVTPVLYYVRDMSRPGHEGDGPQSGVHRVDIHSGEGFDDELRATLATLFDPAVPFTQTPDPKPCEWCDFRTICRH